MMIAAVLTAIAGAASVVVLAVGWAVRATDCPPQEGLR
jgi:hypothetical protein